MFGGLGGARGAGPGSWRHAEPGTGGRFQGPAGAGLVGGRGLDRDSPGLPTWAKWPRPSPRDGTLMRRRIRLGTAARRRRRAGGPRATGRPAASVAEWAAIRAAVLARAGGGC